MRGTYHAIGGAAMLAMSEAALLEFFPRRHDVVVTTFTACPLWPALFVLGCLLPDIDSKGSILGRYLHLPMGHRTWTHSLWPPLALYALAWLVPQTAPFVMPIVTGILTHLVLDSVSTAGICWPYPWPGFRRYPSGAFVKKSNVHHRFFRWYRTGRRSETVVLAITCVVAIAAILVSHLT